MESITDSMDMSLNKLQEKVKGREGRHAAVHGVAKSWTQLSDSTELNCVRDPGDTIWKEKIWVLQTQRGEQ